MDGEGGEEQTEERGQKEDCEEGEEQAQEELQGHGEDCEDGNLV